MEIRDVEHPIHHLLPNVPIIKNHCKYIPATLPVWFLYTLLVIMAFVKKNNEIHVRRLYLVPMQELRVSTLQMH